MVLSDTNTKHNTKSTGRSSGCRALWRRRRRLAKPLPGEGSPVEPSRPFNRAGKRGSFGVAPTSALILVAFPDSMLSTSPDMAPTRHGLVPADALSSTCSQPRTHGREKTLPPPTPHVHEQTNTKIWASSHRGWLRGGSSGLLVLYHRRLKSILAYPSRVRAPHRPGGRTAFASADAGAKPLASLSGQASTRCCSNLIYYSVYGRQMHKSSPCNTAGSDGQACSEILETRIQRSITVYFSCV